VGLVSVGEAMTKYTVQGRFQVCSRLFFHNLKLRPAEAARVKCIQYSGL
jgi:hypothetical protein